MLVQLGLKELLVLYVVVMKLTLESIIVTHIAHHNFLKYCTALTCVHIQYRPFNRL